MIATASKKLLKPIFSLLGAILVIGILLPAVSMGQWFTPNESAFPYDVQGPAIDTVQDEDKTNLATNIIKVDTNEQTSLLKRLTNIFKLNGTSYDSGNPKSAATDYVKWILNTLLGLVSFLALVMIIFAFYLIFFSKGEEGVAKAKKIIIGVAIALAIMGLSWFIASFFFNIYGVVTTV